MMQTFAAGIFTPGDIQCGLAAALLFMLPLRKRPGLAWRFPLSVAVALLAAGLLAAFHQPLMSWLYNWTQTRLLPSYLVGVFHVDVFSFLQLLVLTAVFWFCSDLPLPQQAYGAVCALISETLAYYTYLEFYPQDGYRVIGRLSPEHPWIELLILAFVYALIYFSIAARLPKDREYRFRCGLHSISLFMILLLTRSLTSCARISNFHPESFRMLHVASIMLFWMLLISQLLICELHNWREAAFVESQLLKTQRTEYQRFRKSTDDIRHIGHDLKHILAAMPPGDNGQRSSCAKELEEALADYEAHMDTGNDILDALLAIAWKRCRENRVKWTCTADGTALRSVDPTDLHILLGNALDNAIESVLRTADAEKRFLSLNIWQKAGCAFIKLENYCQTQPVFEDSLPVTTKADHDRHGFGTRSISDIVDRLGGNVSMSAHDEIFTLDIILPLE